MKFKMLNTEALKQEVSMPTKKHKQTNQSRDYKGRKLTPEKLSTIERCLQAGLRTKQIEEITGISVGSISAVKIVLQWLGKLKLFGGV